jgi:lysophospholipase L1-like esterase
MNKIFFRNLITLALFLLFFNQTILFSQQVKDTLKYLTNPNYKLQNDFFDSYKTTQADIIMFGNSLTAGVNWSELLGRANVVGRGIPSDVLQGYYSRLNQVLRLKPKIIFILGGLNDIYNWTSVEEIYAYYVKVLQKIKEEKITPVIQSTTYAGKEWAKSWGGTPEVNAGRNVEVDKLNKMLWDYAQKNKIDYIDLNSKMSTRDRFLRPELTWDGVHLNAEGYKIWAREVEKVLKKNKL